MGLRLDMPRQGGLDQGNLSIWSKIKERDRSSVPVLFFWSPFFLQRDPLLYHHKQISEASCKKLQIICKKW